MIDVQISIVGLSFVTTAPSKVVVVVVVGSSSCS
jgi:hypothetical protein